MPRRPTIGILLDYEASGSFSSRPHYALRTAYFDAIWHAGGLPVGIPYIEAARGAYLAACEGLIVPGGFYPFPPEIYGDAPSGEKLHPRYAFERGLMADALDHDVPTLGICAGMQVMAASRGATMYRDIGNELNLDIDHLNERPAEETAHPVDLNEAGAAGANRLHVRVLAQLWNIRSGAVYRVQNRRAVVHRSQLAVDGKGNGHGSSLHAVDIR